MKALDLMIIHAPKEHLDIEPRRTSLTQRTITGMFWTVSGSGIQAVLKIAVLAVLARLLPPADFGVIGAALIITSFLDIFGQLGLAPAIIRRPGLTEVHIRTGQTASTALGCLMAAILFLFAPRIATSFRIDALEPVVRLLALIFPLKGLAVVPEALMMRQMRFKELAAIRIASYLVGYAAVSIAFASIGWGVDALVMGLLAQAIIARLSLFFLIAPPRGFLLDRSALRDLFNYGGGQTLSSLGNFCALNLDNFIVGRWLGVEALGIYSRAYQFLMQPTNLIGGTIDGVLFAAMGEAHGDDARIDRGYRHSIAIMAMVTLPLSAILIVLAPEVIRLLLGPNWTAVIAPFQILAACLVCRIGHKASDAVSRARGTVYRGAWRQWLYAGEIATGAFVGHYWGTTGVAFGVAVAISVQYLVMLHFGRNLTNVRLTEIALIHLRHLTVALLVAAAILTTKVGLHTLNAPDYAVIISGSAVAGIVVLLLWCLAPPLFGEEGDWIRLQTSKALSRRK